ncbi:MAG TPA: glycosyltransferase family 2 protein [Bacillota bacterium]|nr:glycosyltransferase family 2 protein [Bacillota bacterium]
MKASIIIVNFNSGDHLKRCLQSVVKHTATSDYEVWIIDNHSKDHSLNCLSDFPKYPIHLLANNINLGYAKACNQGLRRATGDLIVTMNPDVIVGPDWLSRLAYHLQAKSVMIVGPMSLGIGGKQWAGPLRFPENLEAANRWFYRQNRHQYQPAKFLIGCLMLMKRNLLEQIGFLDENMLLGADDFDLSLRVRQAGYELRIARDVLVRHVCHVSFGHPDEHTHALAESSWTNFKKKWEAVLNQYDWDDLFENERSLWYHPKQLEAKENQDEYIRRKNAPPGGGPRTYPQGAREENPLIPYTFSQRGSFRFGPQCYPSHGTDSVVGRLRRRTSSQ